MFRKSIPLITIFALLILCFVSCQKEKAVDLSKIDDANTKFMQAFVDGDAAAVTALYTSDAVLLPPFSDAISSPKDNTDIWQAMIDLGVTKMSLDRNELIPAGDMAVERGEYTVFAGNLEIDRGKYLSLWKMENGEWKIHRDIWNSSIPVEEVVDDVEEVGMGEDTE